MKATDVSEQVKSIATLLSLGFTARRSIVAVTSGKLELLLDDPAVMSIQEEQ